MSSKPLLTQGLMSSTPPLKTTAVSSSLIINTPTVHPRLRVCVGTVACELVVKLLIFHEMAEAHVSSHAVCTLNTTSLI